jgi:hypothetical protein
MNPEERHLPSSYPLRLSASVLTAVRRHASHEGVSINHFVELALVEKLARLETDQANRMALAQQQERQSTPSALPSRLPSGLPRGVTQAGIPGNSPIKKPLL